MGLSVRRGLLEAVVLAEKSLLDRVIVSGVESTFATRADIAEFDADLIDPQLPEVLNAIESSSVPWIAAINGLAESCGAELALACRMRVMHPKAQIGFPEVSSGIIPGAGGIQRLPRLVGVEKALSIITSGKPVAAVAALASGLVSETADDVVIAAQQIKSKKLLDTIPTNRLPAPDVDADVYTNSMALLAKKRSNEIAPAKAITVMKQGLTKNFHEALKNERLAFLALRSSEQAESLRHLYTAERDALSSDAIRMGSHNFENGVVIGGGTMGAAISYALASAGVAVTLLENDSESVERAKANVDVIIASSLKRGLINQEGADRRRNMVTCTTDYNKASGASFAIEAAFESMQVKKAVFSKLAAVMPKDAVLATNTSYLDVNEIANSVSHPERVLGLHFFAPAHIMKLLEIVKADKTESAALATGFALGKLLRKIPVVAGVCDGFIGNRILARYREAADTVLLEGATPWDIDRAMVSFGYAMGPYEAQDLSGLDIAHANRRRQDETRDPNRRYIAIADRMVTLDRLGRKTGAGWYHYPVGGKKVEDSAVIDLVQEEALKAGVNRTKYSPEDIQQRMLIAMINEAASILDEGIAQSASDIDLVTVFGYGFPRWRGGLMHYADSLGIQNIVATLENLCSDDPVAWKVSGLLKQCAATGTALRDL